MFEAITERLRARKREQDQTALEQYRSLLAKATADGDLGAGDTAKLEKFADALGRTVEVVDADLSLFAELRDLDRLAAEREARAKAKAAASEAWSAYGRETDRVQKEHEELIRGRERTMSDRSNAYHAAKDAFKAATDAASRAGILRATHAALLGLTSPPIIEIDNLGDTLRIPADATDYMDRARLNGVAAELGLDLPDPPTPAVAAAPEAQAPRTEGGIVIVSD